MKYHPTALESVGGTQLDHGRSVVEHHVDSCLMALCDVYRGDT